jgi:hypothetical protein
MISYYRKSIGCSFKFFLKVGVQESFVNAQRITDQLFQSNLIFCVVCVFTLQTDEWCVHDRLFYVNLRINLNEHSILAASSHNTLLINANCKTK